MVVCHKAYPFPAQHQQSKKPVCVDRRESAYKAKAYAYLEDVELQEVVRNKSPFSVSISINCQHHRECHERNWKHIEKDQVDPIMRLEQVKQSWVHPNDSVCWAKEHSKCCKRQRQESIALLHRIHLVFLFALTLLKRSMNTCERPSCWSYKESPTDTSHDVPGIATASMQALQLCTPFQSSWRTDEPSRRR